MARTSEGKSDQARGSLPAGTRTDRVRSETEPENPDRIRAQKTRQCLINVNCPIKHQTVTNINRIMLCMESQDNILTSGG